MTAWERLLRSAMGRTRAGWRAGSPHRGAWSATSAPPSSPRRPPETSVAAARVVAARRRCGRRGIRALQDASGARRFERARPLGPAGGTRRPPGEGDDRTAGAGVEPATLWLSARCSIQAELPFSRGAGFEPARLRPSPIVRTRSRNTRLRSRSEVWRTAGPGASEFLGPAELRALEAFLRAVSTGG
jgi:hypothetical protein